MFEAFEAQFLRDPAPAQPAHAHSAAESFGLQPFLARYSGATFNNGVYRVATPEIAHLANQFIQTAFPNFSGKVACFASDWLGRLFCLDSTRRESGEPAVLMLEPGTREALNIPANLDSFHDEELIHYADAALATVFYQRWLAQGGPIPRFDQCIGYKKPLFLGGTDTLENLELSDLDVYWTISAQLIAKVRNLPIGTKIGKISLR
jgi:Domain of unknown function (DUF1851)